VQTKDSLSWNQIHHELMSPLTVIAGHTQLLQRQILRANGLTNLERDHLLDDVVSVLGAVETLEAQIGALLPTGDTRPRGPELSTPSPRK
jgi:signal transduction histidine kinase